MASIGLFYGTSHGNTKKVAEMIKEEILDVELHDVYDSSIVALKKYDVLIFGTSTWNHGDLQKNWSDIFAQMDAVDFTGKKVALFGVGDSVRYPKNFVDGIAFLHDKIVEQGGKIIGYWPIAGYHFTESKAMKDGKFVGLAIDETNEPQLTPKRVYEWCRQVKDELV